MTEATIQIKDAAQIEPLLVDQMTAARMLGLGKTLFYELLATGQIPPGVKLGRRRLWSVDELKAWARANCPSREKWDRLREQKGGRQ